MRTLRYLFCLSCFVLSTPLFSQQEDTKVSEKRTQERKELFGYYTVFNKNTLDQYDLIFEGTVVASTTFEKDFDLGFIILTEKLRVYKIKIHKVFKGDTDMEFIESIEVLHGTGHDLNYITGQSGIWRSRKASTQKGTLKEVEYKRQFVTTNDSVYAAFAMFKYRLDQFYKGNERWMDLGEECCPIVNFGSDHYRIAFDTAEEVYALLESYDELSMVRIDDTEFEFKNKEYYETHHQKRSKSLKRWNKQIYRKGKKLDKIRLKKLQLKEKEREKETTNNEVLEYYFWACAKNDYKNTGIYPNMVYNHASQQRILGNYSLVVEAKIIKKQNHLWTNDYQESKAQALLKIHRVFKGEVSNDTIEVTVHGYGDFYNIDTGDTTHIELKNDANIWKEGQVAVFTVSEKRESINPNKYRLNESVPYLENKVSQYITYGGYEIVLPYKEKKDTKRPSEIYLVYNIAQFNGQRAFYFNQIEDVYAFMESLLDQKPLVLNYTHFTINKVSDVSYYRVKYAEFVKKMRKKNIFTKLFKKRKK